MEVGFDVEALVALGRVESHALSPDGTWVAACVHSLDEDGVKYVGTIWRVPTDGGAAMALFEGRFDDRAPGFRRDGTLCFTSNRTEPDHAPDDEPDSKAKRQLWAMTADGSLEQLTDEPLGIGRYRWARQADVLVVQTQVLPGVAHESLREVAEDLEKGPSVLRYTDVRARYWDQWLPDKVNHLVAYVGGQRRVLTPDRVERHPEYGWTLAEDGSFVVSIELIGEIHGIPVGRPVRIDVHTGAQQTLRTDSDAAFDDPHISPDGATLALRRAVIEPGRSFWDELAVVSLADPHDMRILGQGWQASPSGIAGWTRDGSQVLVSVAERGAQALYTVHVASDARRALCGEGTVHGVAIGEGAVVIRRSTYLTPPRLERVHLSSGEREELARLDSLEDLSEHVSVTRIEVAGHGGVPVQSFVLEPRSGGHGRTLVWIHGGPISQWSDGWHWRWSAALAACDGYRVVCPNPRGSTGFGREFVEGIWGNAWGGACAADVLAVVDAVASRDDVDEDRMIAMGGSFGGYMTNWLGTQTDRFAALVTHASLWDFRAFHATTDFPPYWAFMLGLDPWTDTEALERYNPRAHLDGWSTPTLILHGEKDYRVPISEGLALFTALQARGVPSELVVFPDENHWILKPRNVVAWYEAWLGFIERTVGREDGDG